MTDRELLAYTLLQIGAISLRPQEPFLWTSGIQSPIYCDNRLTLSHVIARRLVIDSFVARISEQFPQIECVAGTATAGIPHAAWIAERLGLPMVYVRNSAKSHGKQNQVEGRLLASQKVLVIEDTISTGGSSLAAVAALEQECAHVLGVAAIFNYGFASAAEAFAKKNLPLLSLTDFATLIQVALRMQRIEEGDVEALEQFVQNPYGRT
ncbi:orotate phosphoribosyltransferase [Sulfoacidibacillus thermotolerans]|uniref:Orotate phosphoribosyltransferase n=1 Tax=Sulfoacidibacillus thermotolerans TaxID=1765684 RepID=A0A2U3D7S4_SULT2|nr:orotate phosphoribosyltransferase [Sulfoacidibacillus thermotolerans]PWI57328.1 orotate phosphoribosyltransferase [Sulfoacidibacillus thermotolerans]